MDLEKDAFLDPRVRNIVVLDDMATEAAKDPRVTDLFTEGSHHRNLSVIALNQNLYFSKDPTQRRNCHYLVLFNNPVDKQPIMTLARQMYPSQPQELIRQFEEAVSQKFGYLLVDLKPTTPTGMRMRTDVFSIKGADKNANVQCLEDFQAVQNTLKIGESKLISTENNRISDLINTTEQNQTQFTMPSCDDCGVVFENHHDLQSHVKIGAHNRCL